MKVRNLEINGKNVANQFIITDGTTIAMAKLID